MVFREMIFKMLKKKKEWQQQQKKKHKALPFY